MKTTGIWMDGDDVIERRTEDVEPVLETVKDLRSLNQVGSSEMRHAARLPKAVVENYIARMGITFHDFMIDDQHVLNMLRDPELSGFRIWQGRV